MHQTRFPHMKIELNPRQDRNDETFYIGKIRVPAVLKMNKGLAFFVFTSETDGEMLEIAGAAPGSECLPVKRMLRADNSIARLAVSLEPKIDTHGAKYYLGIVQDDGLELDLTDGYLFFIFVSKEGSEQLQIVKHNSQEDESRSRNHRGAEIHRKERSSESGSYDRSEPLELRKVGG